MLASASPALWIGEHLLNGPVCESLGVRAPVLGQVRNDFSKLQAGRLYGLATLADLRRNLLQASSKALPITLRRYGCDASRLARLLATSRRKNRVFETGGRWRRRSKAHRGPAGLCEER
jgi:hypothetical protein